MPDINRSISIILSAPPGYSNGFKLTGRGVEVELKANSQKPITEFTLYLLVSKKTLSGTFFPNFIFASDNAPRHPR